MSYKTDVEINLEPAVKSNYIISSQHRKKGNPLKCVWLITFDEEIQCFIQTINEKWKDGSEAWGLKLSDAVLQVVGTNDSEDELKFAKFVDGSDTDVWHGCPADYMKRSQDRPSTDILKIWTKKGYITKAKMSKIRRAQSCNL